MSVTLRNRIAYWFFLLLGMSALVNQYFIQGWTHVWYVEIIKTLLFGIFALKPLVLIDIQKSISTYFINKSKKGLTDNLNTKDTAKTDNEEGVNNVGGGGIDETNL